MICERYTLILRHEIVDTEKCEIHQYEPPLAVIYTMYDTFDRHEIMYSINRMLKEMEHGFLKRLDANKQEVQE